VVTQRMRRQLGRGFAWMVIAAPLAAGCASNAPLATTKLAQAERAVDEAQQSGAAVSVPVELRTAEDKLKAARTAMANKDYDVAIRQAEQAAVDADYARARAVNDRVKKMADEMRANIQTLRQELERLPQ
jgi:flagellar biosynthesis/type III secretory pathway protein FliH